MKNRFLKQYWALILLLGWSWAACGPGLQMDAIKNLYNEGDFEKIRVSLESFLKKSGKTAQVKEKIFAYKYLGVIYAAEPDGTPLAETFFYQLLKIAPNAHLSDLYVSSAVENVFVRTKERFKKEQAENQEYDEFGNPRNPSPGPGTGLKPDLNPSPKPYAKPVSPKPSEPQLKPKRHIWPWLIGVGIVGGVAVYFWISSLDNKDTVIDGT